MARLAAIALVSGGFHAGVLAWLSAVDVTLHVAAPPAPVAVEIVAPPPPPPPAPAAGTTGLAASTRAGPAAVIAAGHATPRGSGGEPARAPSRHPYLAMRAGGTRPDLSLPATIRDEVPATLPAPAPDIPRNTDLGSFQAHVDKDGDVTLRDSGDFTVRWAMPSARMIGQGITDWYRSDKGPDGQRGARTLEDQVQGTIDAPTTGCNGVRDSACAPDRTPTAVVPVLRGGFNPTDWLMRRTVGDPYASKKRAYLDATREQRAQVRATHRAELEKRTAELVRRNLERAWSSTTDPFTRKELLFELWDEIADDGRASSEARAQVIGFIRARLPQRDQGAYSAAELAAFNARKQSKETFSPYE